MASFLVTNRSKESYEQRINTEPTGTQKCRRYSVKNFEAFVSEMYDGRSTDDVVQELFVCKANKGEEFEYTLYGVLQEWINWNERKGRNPNTIRVTFSNLRKYFFYRGIKTNAQDIGEFLRFSKIPKEEKHPLSNDEYSAIVNAFSKSPLSQSICLTLGASGMRLGELMNVKKKHLDLTARRIKVKIPPHTKTRTGRTTFLTKEAAEKIQKRLEKLGPEDYVFCKQSPLSGGANFRHALRRILNRLELNERYESNNFYKITTHSFRAYFFTKAARKHGDNYAHRMTGHGGYLMEYDRMTEEEKMDMYIELEPDLVVYEQTKNKLKIEQLEEENSSISQLREEIRKLKEQQAKQDKKILDKLRENKTLPI